MSQVTRIVLDKTKTAEDTAKCCDYASSYVRDVAKELRDRYDYNTETLRDVALILEAAAKHLKARVPPPPKEQPKKEQVKQYDDGLNPPWRE